MRIKHWIIVWVVVAILAFSAGRAIGAESVGLQWNATTDNVGVTKYTVYWGQESRNYSDNMDVDLNLTATISNLLIGITYFFTVSASDAAGNTSEYSNEISWLAVDKTPPGNPVNLKIIIIVQ